MTTYTKKFKEFIPEWNPESDDYIVGYRNLDDSEIRIPLLAVDNSITANKYIRKDIDDYANGIIRFNKGFTVSNKVMSTIYLQGLDGWMGTQKGDFEMNSLILREFLEVPELRKNKITVMGNQFWFTDSAMVKVANATGSDNYDIYFKLEDEEYAPFELNDIIKGIYHYDNGFWTVYLKVYELIVNPDTGGEIGVKAHSMNGRDPRQSMLLARMNNSDNPERQGSIFADGLRKYIRVLDGYNPDDPTSEGSIKTLKVQIGDLSTITNHPIFGDLEGYGLYADNVYLTGKLIVKNDPNQPGQELGVYRGVWNNQANYYKYDQVTYKGSLFTSKQIDNIGHIPTGNVDDLWWELTVAKGEDGTSAESNIIIELTNDNHNIPTDSEGKNPSYGGAYCTAYVFQGTNDITDLYTISATVEAPVTSQQLQIVQNDNTVTITHISDDIDAAAIKFTATAVGYPTVTRTWNVSKVKSGTPGEPATAYWIVTDSPVIKKYVFNVNDSEVIRYEPSPFVVRAFAQTGQENIRQFDGYFRIKYGTQVNIVAGSVYQFTPQADVDNYTIEFFLEQGLYTLLDKEIITVVEDGRDGDTPDWNIFIFKKGPEQPSAPTFTTPPSSYPSDGWYDYPTSDGIWWMSTAVVNGNSKTIASWSVPVKTTGEDGLNGADGVDGADGKSIMWKGTFTSHPSNPENGWAYYNSIDKKSYVYQSGSWYQMTVDGVDGANGPQGVPGEPGKDGKVYFTWIRYADTSTGGGISNDPTGKEYIGFAYNKETPTESSTPGDYIWSLIKGDKGDTGVAGTPGEDGTTYYTWIKYSDYADGTYLYDVPKDTTMYIGIAVNKITAAESNLKTDYTWSKFKGEIGPQGVPGEPGADGITYYTWIRYADTFTGDGIANDPTDKMYIGFAYNKTTSTESNTPSDYIWSLIKGPKGDTGVEGAPGSDGQTYYTWIKYSDNADGTGLYDIPNANTKYIGIAVNKTIATESSVKTDYTWSQFKGDTGATGPQGVAGAPGADGITYYTWIRYADTSVGGGISNDPTGKLYIGFAYNKTTPIESNVPGDYKWSRYHGEDGTDGIPGTPGADGKTYYTWIAYSDYANGKDMYQVPNENTKYIGIAVNKLTEIESTNPADYTWSKFKGDPGENGLDIIWKGELKNPPTSPQLNWVYKDTDNGIVYIWNGTAWALMVADGSDGTNGTNGSNGLSVFITYHDNTIYNKPATPTGNGTVAGWHTTPTSACVWMSQKVSSTATSGTWGAPIQLRGENGGYVDFKYAVSTSHNTPPSIVKTDRQPAGWSDVPPTVTSGLFLWMVNAFINPDNTLNGVWSDPMRISGETGPEGPRGPQGLHGNDGLQGPSIAFGGNWSSTTQYYGYADTQTCVYYGGKYYYTKPVSPDLSPLTIPSGATNNPASANGKVYWNEFVGQFDNIATGLLLAERIATSELTANKLFIVDRQESTGNIIAADGSIITKEEEKNLNPNQIIGRLTKGWYLDQGVIRSISVNSDNTPKLILDKDGKITATGVNVTGTVHFENGTIGSLQVFNDSAWTATVNGPYPASSGFYYLRKNQGVTVTPQGHIIGKDYFLTGDSTVGPSVFIGDVYVPGSSVPGTDDSTLTSFLKLFNSLFERVLVNSQYHIKAKLPLFSVGEITAYGDDNMDIPSIWGGIPVDKVTIDLIDGKLTVIGGTGGIKGISLPSMTAEDALVGASLNAAGDVITFTKGTFATKAYVTWGNITNKPSTFTPSTHTHIISNITGLQTELDGKAPVTHYHDYTSIVKLGSTIYTVSNNIISLPSYPTTLPASDVPAWAKLSTLSAAINNQLTVGTTTPSDADYYISQYAGGGTTTVTYHRRTHSALFTYIQGKLPSWSTSASKPVYSWTEITGKPTTFTPSTHSHTIAQVTGLQSALDGKSATSHTHTFASITSKPTTISGYGIADAYTDSKIDRFLALKLDFATFNDLFEKVNTGTTASPVYAIKAKYNFYSVGEVSAFGAAEVSSGGSGATTVGELNNVDESFDTCPDGIYSWQKKGQVFFPIEGATGGGSSKMTLTFITPASPVVVHGGDAIIRWGFSSTLDNEPTGPGYAEYAVNGKVVYSETVQQGEVSVNLGKFLKQGDNTLITSVTDSYGNLRKLTYNINAINVSISSTFDISRVYPGSFSFAYTPVGAVEKFVHFILDGIEIGTVTTTASNRQQTYVIPAQTHGAHSLEVYMTAIIDGTSIESNHLFYEFISIKEGNNTPVIASSFRETDAEQFSTIVVPYMVYNPTATMADITLSANGNIVSTQSVNRTPQTWSYRTVDSGALALKIACGSVSRTFNLTVSESDIDVNAETADLVLFLTSINRSNNEEGRNIWNYEEIYALLTAFNWATNGWIKTIEGFVALRINGDARVTIPYNSFAGDFRATGKTLEFEFETRDVTDYDKVILSCMNGGIGLQVTAQSAVFKSRQTTITTQFKEDERVRISFVVEKRAENRLIYVYINGEMCGVVQYPEQDDFTQSNPVGISIGSDVCTTDIFNIRVYDNNLNRYQLLDNYLSDMDNLEVKKGLFADNNIYDDYGNVSYNKVVDKVPALTIIGRLPAYKGDKVTCQMAYEDKQIPNRSWTCNSVQNDVQGTSSQYYPRKNYKFKFKSSLTMQDGSTADKFAVREGAIPVNCFCTKADFAEASGCHNTGMARMVDFVLRGLGQLTPPQKTDSRVRTTIDGYPIVIFHKETEDSEPTFLGKYNFNNDKSTQETFGFTSGCECWEILNNTSNRVLFKTSDYTTEEWKKDFEARYPEDYTDNTKLKRLTDWLVSVKGNPTKFKQEAPQYLNIPFILSYYILTEFFAMVDQRAKNMFLTTFDGIHWFSIFYDNDTCLGINNEGVNAFDFTVEYHDKLGTQDVWNGEQSTLWNNVEQAYATEISTMYAEMRKNGLLTYERCDYYLNQEQCDKWSASIYNEDGWFKYVMPLLEEDNGSYLYAAQGSRKMHRIWWLYNRFKYMDSRYIAGDYMNDFATMRLYTPTSWEGVEPNANITLTSYVGQYINVKYGSYIVGSHAKKNVPVTIQAPDIRFNDTETIIYGASQINSLGDLSALYAGTVDVSKMDKLTELIVGSGVSGYKNTNLTVLSVGANNLLRKLDVRNCPNLTQAIDVSKCGGIREIWAEGTGITGISLPEGGNLTLLHLPDTITNLTLRNQAHLESAGLVISGIENLNSIRWENNKADVLPILRGASSLERMRVIGINWSMDDLEFIDTLAELGGLDESNNNISTAILTGKVHVKNAHEGWLNHVRSVFPELIITYDTLVSIPTHTITIYGKDTSAKLPNADVTVNGTKYVTDSDGKVFVKTSDKLVVEVNCDGYLTAKATYAASSTSRSYSISLNKIVNFTIKVTDQYGGGRKNVKVTYSSEVKLTDDSGVAVFKTSVGTYSWKAEHGNSSKQGNVTIQQADVLQTVIFEVIAEDYRPIPNGNIQMLLIGSSVQVTVNSTTTDYVIDWMDGTAPTNASGTGSKTYTHTYSSSGSHPVEIKNCVDVIACNSTAAYLSAYWTIGDSKVMNLSFDSFNKLEIVGGDLFKNDNVRTSFSCFPNCSQLTSIPAGLFDNCTNVTIFSNCFNGCSQLTSIPSGLFDNCTNVTNFSYCFLNCIQLTSIPVGLFDNCTNVTNFNSCFNNCNKLTSISAGLFDNCTKVTDFRHCFYNCSQLTSIPSGLFDNCPKVTSFSNCFYKCSQLTSIPAGLFDNCPKVTSFSNCFMYCYALQLFESKITKVDSNMFQMCSSLILVQINNDTVCPLVYTDAFDNTNAALQIKVPANLVDSYKAATNWISLADKITAI